MRQPRVTTRMLDFILKENLGTILKALTPRVTVPFAAAAWILLYIHMRGLTPLPAGVIAQAWIVAILCTCLALTSFVTSLWSRIAGLWQHYRDKRRTQTELKFLTPKEREIIAYLLAKQQRVFEVLPDGEEARSLMAKGFVVRTARRPPTVHRDITVEVPPHVWEVLIRNRSRFPCQTPDPETRPWRTHWMAR